MENKEIIKDFKTKFPTTSSFFSGLTLFFVDAIVLFLCIGIGFFIVNLFVPRLINFRSFINYSVYIPVILLMFGCFGLYPGIMIPPNEEVKKFGLCTLICFIAIIISIFISELNDSSISRLIVKDSKDFPVVIAFCISYLFSLILLPSIREVVKRLCSHSKWWGVPAVIFCNGNSGDAVIDRLLKHPYLGYHPAIIIDIESKENHDYRNIPVYAPSSELLAEIRKLKIKTAVLCDYHGEVSEIMTSFRYTITVSKSQTSFTSSQQLKDIAGIIGFSSTHNLTFKVNLIIKRIIDILFVIIVSPIVIPIMLILTIVVKVSSKGPVFYGHKRVGKNGKEFKCWKFRSMVVNADKMLDKLLAENPEMKKEWDKDCKLENDPRVTKVGRFLRKTSLDELPQIINIFTGEMSLVGPRPVTEPELVKYGKYKDYVLSVTPGLTGMWQVSGRSDTGYEERISFDSYYIQNWSIWLDIWILIKTVWVVIKGKGAY